MNERTPSLSELRKLRLRDQCQAAGDAGQTLRWHCGFDALPRLADSAQAPDAAAQFGAVLRVRERRLPDGSAQAEAELAVEGAVTLICQRCLENYSQPLAGLSRFVLVDSEAEADALFEETGEDDAAPEPLVAARPVDALELMEDELLLALPLVPRHTVCPDSAATRRLAEKEQPVSPFAALAPLKKP